jgi:hypothetical protein
MEEHRRRTVWPSHGAQHCSISGLFAPETHTVTSLKAEDFHRATLGSP